MVGCVLSQLKPSGFSILSWEKGLGLRPRTFFTAKNGEFLWLYPIRLPCVTCSLLNATIIWVFFIKELVLRMEWDLQMIGLIS